MEQSSEPQNLLEWFSEKYTDFGANLEFVTNRSQEGSQFVKGFGGIGGILRYKVDFAQIADAFLEVRLHSTLTALALIDYEQGEDEFYSDDEL